MCSPTVLRTFGTIRLSAWNLNMSAYLAQFTWTTCVDWTFHTGYSPSTVVGSVHFGGCVHASDFSVHQVNLREGIGNFLWSQRISWVRKSVPCVSFSKLTRCVATCQEILEILVPDNESQVRRTCSPVILKTKINSIQQKVPHTTKCKTKTTISTPTSDTHARARTPCCSSCCLWVIHITMRCFVAVFAEDQAYAEKHSSDTRGKARDLQLTLFELRLWSWKTFCVGVIPLQLQESYFTLWLISKSLNRADTTST